MTTITKKQILIDTANHIISRGDTSLYSENLRELARIALASLEAEPYGYTDGDRFGMAYEPRHADRLMKPRPLYPSSPAPVVPPEQSWEELCRQNPDMSIGDAIIRAAWWNLCRAAMLKSSGE